MSLASDVLLQANVAAKAKAKTSASAVGNSLKPAETSKAEASSFSSVYAGQSASKPATERETPTSAAREPSRDKPVVQKDKPVAGKDKPVQPQNGDEQQGAVAESGNGLPEEQVVAVSDEGDTQADSGEETDPQLLAALAAQQAALPVPVVPEEVKPQPEAAAEDGDQTSVVATIATLPVVAAATSTGAQQDSFDPDSDPLDGLHALQFALETANGKNRPGNQAVTQHDKQTQGQVDADPEADAARSQNLVNNLASLGDQSAAQDGSTESSDQSFASVLGDGLKDTKSAASDTRVDNFAERLAALSQAAQPQRVVTATPTVSPLSQPLAMHQSGWSEGIVDRVMYLSSQNLKSAEIKLEPAELGRLDIRVNMAPDQQTQVTFASAHLGVRDALESQVARLRESFSQQGLGQVDVNVSDQSQQQAQQQAQEQASRAQRGGGRGGIAEGADSEIATAAPVPASQPVQRVIGTSEIDFYA